MDKRLLVTKMQLKVNKKELELKKIDMNRGQMHRDKNITYRT